MALDLAFDAGTLSRLRKAVFDEAAGAGMPNHRAADVVIAVHELAANVVRHGATISPAARDLLLTLVGALLAQQGEQVVDHDAGLRLRAVPGPDTVVSSPDGDTTFVGLSLTVSAAADENWAEPELSVAQ